MLVTTHLHLNPSVKWHPPDSNPKKEDGALPIWVQDCPTAITPPNHVPHHGDVTTNLPTNAIHNPSHAVLPQAPPAFNRRVLQSLVRACPQQSWQKSGGSGDAAVAAKVIRYTREKLLSLRGRGDEGASECVLDLEGSMVVSKVAQDPGEFLQCYFLPLLVQQESCLLGGGGWQFVCLTIR